MSARPFKLSIPKPCHEDWDKMTPNEQGRHCDHCQKTVVDFSAKSDEEIKRFFEERNYQAVCGRFTNIQLDRVRIYLPQDIFIRPIPLWQKYLAMLLICFGSMVFSLDVLVGGYPSVQAQEVVKDDANAQKKKNIHKKNHRRKQLKLTSVSPEAYATCVMISGFTVMEPEPAQSPAAKILRDISTDMAALTFRDSVGDRTAIIKQNEDKNDDPGEPVRDEGPPFRRWQFILPEILQRRKSPEADPE